MRRILVTGGCGFIGSHFIRQLLAGDAALEVINIDSLTYAGNTNNLVDLAGDSRYRFVRADITDAAAVRRVMVGVDSIVHFAAQSHVDRSIRDAAPFVKTNVLGTQVLLDLAIKYHVRRFVHVSTDEVYGSLGPSGACTEDAPLAPNNPYAASKAAADLLVRSYAQTHGLPAIITRCGNNYGPYQHPEKLIPCFITKLLRNEPVPIYGDGLQVRDWIHVSDHCGALELIWRRGRVGEIYHIGGGCEWTNLELTRHLLHLLNRPDSLIRRVDDRPGHDRRYALDCHKIAAELGWLPTIDFAEGLEQTVRWYESHTRCVPSLGRAVVGELAGAGRRDSQTTCVGQDSDPDRSMRSGSES